MNLHWLFRIWNFCRCTIHPFRLPVANIFHLKQEICSKRGRGRLLVAAGSVKIRNTDRKWVVLPVDWANLSEMTFLVFAAEVCKIVGRAGCGNGVSSIWQNNSSLCATLAKLYAQVTPANLINFHLSEMVKTLTATLSLRSTPICFFCSTHTTFCRVIHVIETFLDRKIKKFKQKEKLLLPQLFGTSPLINYAFCSAPTGRAGLGWRGIENVHV